MLPVLLLLLLTSSYVCMNNWTEQFNKKNIWFLNCDRWALRYLPVVDQSWAPIKCISIWNVLLKTAHATATGRCSVIISFQYSLKAIAAANCVLPSTYVVLFCWMIRIKLRARGLRISAFLCGWIIKHKHKQRISSACWSSLDVRLTSRVQITTITDFDTPRYAQTKYTEIQAEWGGGLELIGNKNHAHLLDAYSWPLPEGFELKSALQSPQSFYCCWITTTTTTTIIIRSHHNLLSVCVG